MSEDKSASELDRETAPFVTRIEWEPHRDTDGKIKAFDEMVTGPVDMIHIERMDTGAYWMAIYRGDHAQRIWIEIEKRTLVARTEID